MNQQLSLSAILMEKALHKKNKIGIGITKPTEEHILGLHKAAEFCHPVVYGADIKGFESVAIENPEIALFYDLEAGLISAAIRGQISADPFRERFIRHYDKHYNPIEEMITVIELPDSRPMLISPVSNLTEGGISEREKLIEASIRLCKSISLPVKIGLLSCCRFENLVDLVGTTIEQFYFDTEHLVNRYKDRFDIKNYEIDFEKAYQDGVTILIEPNGTTGNQLIRTLYFLNVIRFYGAPYMNSSHIVLETFKNGKDYPDVMLLAAALANFNSTNKKNNSL
jgi:predicted methyltransferase MtxX (methanogen marker protein 4)